MKKSFQKFLRRHEKPQAKAIKDQPPANHAQPALHTTTSQIVPPTGQKLHEDAVNVETIGESPALNSSGREKAANEQHNAQDNESPDLMKSKARQKTANVQQKISDKEESNSTRSVEQSKINHTNQRFLVNRAHELVKVTRDANNTHNDGRFPTDKSARIAPADLWDEAYEKASEAEPELTSRYETILSAKMIGTIDTEAIKSFKNLIVRDPDERRKQMKSIVERGLKRTDKDTRIKHKLNSGLHAIEAIQGAAKKSVQASTEAAIAWACVCIAIEVIKNPIGEALKNRQGLEYVILRAKWYESLAISLFGAEDSILNGSNLQIQVRQHVVDLYSKFLLYQMKSVISYYRRRVKAIVNDFLLFDDWAGQIHDIEQAETLVKNDVNIYYSIQVQDTLTALMKGADDAVSAVRNQTREYQKDRQTDKDQACIRDLCAGSPLLDKERIESMKGGLVSECYEWIFDNSEYQRWLNDDGIQSLWLSGNPGQGKTMLLCGMIDRLRVLPYRDYVLAYFFCQASDTNANNATAVLRGIIYLLIDEEPSLLKHVRQQYEKTGKSLFEGNNAWYALTGIFKSILQDVKSRKIYILVDALDECRTDRDRLLNLISQTMTESRNLNWLVASRPWSEIEVLVQQIPKLAHLRLAPNSEHMSSAVDFYINYKVEELRTLHKYREDLVSQIREHLTSNAHGTFLWVALVCQSLVNMGPWGAIRKIKEVPATLTETYDYMMECIEQGDSIYVEACKSVLSVATFVRRPVTLLEMGTLAEGLDEAANDRVALLDIIGRCGSFLSIQNETLYFVHQTAKDYILGRAAGTEMGEHAKIYSKSLEVMKKVLKRNLYGIDGEGLLLEEIEVPAQNPLSPIAYSCLHWADHLAALLEKEPASVTHFTNGSALDVFLRTIYLFWIEALVLLKNLMQGIRCMAIVVRTAETFKGQDGLVNLAKDALRFIRYHAVSLENAPLQIYSSGLLLSPSESKVRKLYQQEEPEWVITKPHLGFNWSPYLQTLIRHKAGITAIAFSSDGRRLISATHNGTIVLWDTSNGEPLFTFSKDMSAQIHPHDRECYYQRILFFGDHKLVTASSVWKKHDPPRRHEMFTLYHVWNVSGPNIRYLRTLDPKQHNIEAECTEACAPSGSSLASFCYGGTIKVWNTDTGTVQAILDATFISVLSSEKGSKDRRDHLRLRFREQNELVLLGGADFGIRLWYINTGLLHEPTRQHTSPRSQRWWLSEDAELILDYEEHEKTASMVCGTLAVRYLRSGEVRSPIQSSSCCRAFFSADSTALMIIEDRPSRICIYDTSTGVLRFSMTGEVYMAATFTSEGNMVAYGTHNGIVKIWDMTTSQESDESFPEHIYRMRFIAEGRILLIDGGNMIAVYDLGASMILRRFDDLPGSFMFASSKYSTLFAIGFTDSDEIVVRVQDSLKDDQSWETRQQASRLMDLVLSPSGDFLAMLLVEKGMTSPKIMLWHTSADTALSSTLEPRRVIDIEGGSSAIEDMSISPDGRFLALHYDSRVIIWSLQSNQMVKQEWDVDDRGSLRAQTRFSFLQANDLVRTGTGVYKIESATGHHCLKLRPVSASEKEVSCHSRFGLMKQNDRAGDWITHMGRRVLRIHPNLQLNRSTIAIYESWLAFYTRKGGLKIMQFDMSKLPKTRAASA